jgi:hypothetical protein
MLKNLSIKRLVLAPERSANRTGMPTPAATYASGTVLVSVLAPAASFGVHHRGRPDVPHPVSSYSHREHRRHRGELIVAFRHEPQDFSLWSGFGDDRCRARQHFLHAFQHLADPRFHSPLPVARRVT